MTNIYAIELRFLLTLAIWDFFVAPRTKDYKFAGNKGNAVPWKIAAALCRELIV